MPYSMESYLRIARPHLDPEIVSASSFASMLKIAQLMYPASSTLFECRLQEKDKRVDFGFRYLRSNLQSLLSSPSSPVSLLALPGDHTIAAVWQRLDNFCQVWNDPTSPLVTDVDDIWLEFDLPDKASLVPTPSIYIDFNLKSPQNKLENIRYVTELVSGYALKPSFLAHIMACIYALPPEGYFFALGIMLSRQMAAVRICVNIAITQIRPYLTSIGWPGSQDELESLLQPFSGFVERVSLALDIGDQIFPKLGIEYNFEDTSGLKKSITRWQTALDHLTTLGYCTPKKRDSLCSWFGYTLEKDDASVWPENLRAISQADSLSFFHRRMSHIKVATRPDGTLEIKVYLELLQLWLGFDAAQKKPVYREHSPLYLP